VAAALFASGMIYGWLMYLDRSPIRERHVPGTPAYWQHLILPALACVVVGYARRVHQRRSGHHGDRPWLLAPLGKAAARRAARTVFVARRGLSGIGRAALALPPAGLFLYTFFRCGIQVTGGVDPNGTVNAWGGPTYLGAIAFHYLDGILLIAAAGWLLDLILLPDRQQDQGAPGDQNGATAPADSAASDAIASSSNISRSAGPSASGASAAPPIAASAAPSSPSAAGSAA
jgi:hypothetical protein